jgi:hypothetical protein
MSFAHLDCLQRDRLPRHAFVEASELGNKTKTIKSGACSGYQSSPHKAVACQLERPSPAFTLTSIFVGDLLKKIRNCATMLSLGLCALCA